MQAGWRYHVRKRPPTAGECTALLIPDQMEFPSKLAVHRHHGAVDVADQAVAENDIGDFPIPALANVRKPAHRGHGRSVRLPERYGRRSPAIASATTATSEAMVYGFGSHPSGA